MENLNLNLTQMYLQNARVGRGTWWIYLLGAVLILVLFWVILGGFATAAMFVLFSALGVNIRDLTGVLMNTGNADIDKNAAFLIANIAFPFFLLGIWVVVKFLHQRPFTSLITAAPRVRWKRIWIAFGIWFGLGAVMSLLEFTIWPQTFSWSFQADRFAIFLLLALSLTPLQTSAEELFFRGYLLQGVSLFLRNRLALSFISGVIFALPHFANPEVSADFWLAMAYYFAFGFFLAWITLQDGGLEAALGMHAANNLYGGAIVNFQGSALPTYALVFTTHFDPLYNLLTGLAAMVIFYIIFGWLKNGSGLNRTG